MQAMRSNMRMRHFSPCTITNFYLSCTDRETEEHRRHHRHPSAVQRMMTRAVRASGLGKRATCHTLRHSSAFWVRSPVDDLTEGAEPAVLRE